MPRTRSDALAYSLRAQADLARLKGRFSLAERLEQEAERFDISRSTIVPGTMPCVRLETT